MLLKQKNRLLKMHKMIFVLNLFIKIIMKDIKVPFKVSIWEFPKKKFFLMLFKNEFYFTFVPYMMSEI